MAGWLAGSHLIKLFIFHEAAINRNLYGSIQSDVNLPDCFKNNDCEQILTCMLHEFYQYLEMNISSNPKATIYLLKFDSMSLHQK